MEAPYTSDRPGASGQGAQWVFGTNKFTDEDHARIQEVCNTMFCVDVRPLPVAKYRMVSIIPALLLRVAALLPPKAPKSWSRHYYASIPPDYRALELCVLYRLIGALFVKLLPGMYISCCITPLITLNTYKSKLRGSRLEARDKGTRSYDVSFSFAFLS